MSEMDTTASSEDLPERPVASGVDGYYSGSASYLGSEVVVHMTTTDPAVLALAQERQSVDAFHLVAELVHLGAVAAQLSANELSTRVLSDAVKRAEDTVTESTAEAVTDLAQSLTSLSEKTAKDLVKSLDDVKAGIHAEVAGEDSALRASVGKAVDGIIERAVVSIGRAQVDHEERLRRQLSLDDEASPLSSLRRHVAEQHRVLVDKVDVLLQAQSAADGARAIKVATPVHGDEYEEAVIAAFGAIAGRGHDGFEDTHATPGRGGRSKVGDFVVCIDPGTPASIRAAFEVKDEHQSATKWRELLRQSLQNREAAVAVGIARTAEQFPGGGQRAWWISEREAVVAWDPAVDDDETLFLLWSLIRTKALASNVAEHESLDLAKVDHHLTCAESHLSGLDSIESAASAARTQMDRISQATGKVKRQVLAELAAAAREISAAA